MRLLASIIVTLFISVWVALSLREERATPCSAWVMDDRDQPHFLYHFCGFRLLRLLRRSPVGRSAVANTGPDFGSESAATP